MAYLKYADGEKVFNPLVITVDSLEALNALFSVASKAYHASEDKGLIESVSKEMMGALSRHAQENDLAITVTA